MLRTMEVMGANLVQPNVWFVSPERWTLHRRCTTTTAFGSSPSSREEFLWQTTSLGGCWSRRITPIGDDLGVGRRSKYQVRAGVSDSESTVVLKNLVEEVEKMRVKAIKDELAQLGVSFADCFEKRDLVVRLASARLNKDSTKSRDAESASAFVPLAQMPLLRLHNTVNSPKNYILVPLYINKQGPFNFILDTGSSVTLVQPSIVIDTLRLPLRPAQQSLALLGGGLSNQNVMSVNFPNVGIGTHSMTDVSALLMDKNMLQGWDPSIAGLLGLNVLSQFDVEFDFKKDLLILHSPGAASREECNLKDMKQLETTEITLGILGLKAAFGRAAPEVALLDLGSSLCVATPDVARLAGVPNDQINSKRPALGGGGMGQLTSMQFSSAYLDISLITKKQKNEFAGRADFTVKGAQFAIGEVPALRAVGCRLLLGVNLFRSVRMIFSQSTKRVYIEWPTA